MLIQAFCSGPLDTNAYVVTCKKTNKSCLIDAPLESFQTIQEYLKKHHYTLESLFLTHSHFDHIADVAQFTLHYPKLALWVHSEDAKNVESPGSDRIPLFFSIDAAQVTGFLEQDQEHKLGDLTFTVIHTPGHSPGSVCFYFESNQVLFSGDTLFKSSIGTLSLPTSEPDRMWTSLKKLEILPQSVKVYPGHGNPTTIGQESWLKYAQEHFG
jgi:hydroxyacylglutathione hydrolase